MPRLHAAALHQNCTLRPRRVAAKIEWQRGELFPHIGFVVTSFRLPAGKVTKVTFERYFSAIRKQPIRPPGSPKN
ncbi:MAG: hypothetical protein ACLQED_04150 [Desulfobaccales bacterium]